MALAAGARMGAGERRTSCSLCTGKKFNQKLLLHYFHLSTSSVIVLGLGQPLESEEQMLRLLGKMVDDTDTDGANS